jgi:hypothetical protein
VLSKDSPASGLCTAQFTAKPRSSTVLSCTLPQEPQTYLELVSHHVPQALVVHQANVDVTGHLLTRDTADQRLLAVLGKAAGLQPLPEVLDGIPCMCTKYSQLSAGTRSVKESRALLVKYFLSLVDLLLGDHSPTVYSQGVI